MYFSEDELKVILSDSENTFFTLIIELIEVWYEHEKERFLDYFYGIHLKYVKI